MGKVVQLTPREKVNHYQLLEPSTAAQLATLPFTSDWLEVAPYPDSMLHIHCAGVVTGLSVDVEASNIAIDGAGEKIATAVAANKGVRIPPWRYVRIVVNTGFVGAGTVGAAWSGSLQS